MYYLKMLCFYGKLFDPGTYSNLSSLSGSVVQVRVVLRIVVGDVSSTFFSKSLPGTFVCF